MSEDCNDVDDDDDDSISALFDAATSLTLADDAGIMKKMTATLQQHVLLAASKRN